jgi:spore maturation protein SpmB
VKLKDFKLTKQEFLHRIIRPSLKSGMQTAIWLLKLTIPVSFGVFMLDYWGVLDVIAKGTEPFFRLLGLTGKASIVLITSYFVNIYSVIAVMATLDISLREGLILANMCLIAHSLIVETGILKKTGSSAFRMVVLRLLAGFLAAWLLNLVLPPFEGRIHLQAGMAASGFWNSFAHWLKAMAVTSLKIIILVNLLLILQKGLSETGILRWLEKPFHPIMQLMGLPVKTSFLWIVANTIGLSYGGAIMISQSVEGSLSAREADLLNHHIAVSHSQLEDTLLFAAIGLSVPWLMIPRFLLAIAVVWGRRLELAVKSRM